MGRHQFDNVWRDSNTSLHSLHDCRSKSIACDPVRLARLSNHDQAVSLQSDIVDANSRHAPFPHACHTANDLLDFLWIEISSSLDNHVLAPRSDEELAVGQIAEIAGIHPTVVKHFARSVRISEVARHGRRSSELDSPLGAFLDRELLVVDDSNFVLRQGMAG